MTKAVVIGAGHNGLTAAAMLAKAGMEVVVCEKRDAVGGVTSTYELAPGFRASVGPDWVGLLSPDVSRDLSLSEHGLQTMELDPIAFAPSSGGAGLALWRDQDKTLAEIGRFSASDAKSFPRFQRLVEDITGFMEPLLSKPPSTPDIRTAADLVEMLKLGLGFRKLGTATMHELLRVMPMSISDFLDEWFESPQLKALLAGPALENICLGPRAQGTAALFLYQRMTKRARIAKGGAGGVADALSRAAAAAGATVRTGCAVAAIRVEDGRARGVTLDNGESVDASFVLSSVSPRRTFLELSDPSVLPPSFVSEVSRIRYRGVTAKLDLALSELPEFSCRPSADGGSHLGGVIQLGPDLDYLERAYQTVKYDEDSEHPFLQAVVPTLADPSLAPPGQHVMSILVQYVPCTAKADEARIERVVESLSALAPNLRGAILARRMRLPSDYESELGLPEGSFHHGEMALDQMFFMRPVPEFARYETPIDGLILGGPGCHPGGGVTAIPGANAARAVLDRS